MGERVARCVSSKRRSYGSWLTGLKAELLKTNPRLSSGRDLAATFSSLGCGLGGNEKPRPSYSRAEREP